MNIMANEKIKIAFEKEKNNIVLIENNQTRKHTYLTLLDYTRGDEQEAYNIFYWLYIRGTYKNAVSYTHLRANATVIDHE